MFGRADRGRYATDASIYQMEPIGVLVPRTIGRRRRGDGDRPRRRRRRPAARRGNEPVRTDGEPRARARLLEISAPCAGTERGGSRRPGRARHRARPAQRRSCKPHGLFFPVDPSTHSRCTIGGMAGNNSCGAKSIRYGLMADNVTAIDAILADGARCRFGPDWPAEAAGPDGIAESGAAPQGHWREGSRRDRRAIPPSAPPGGRLQHRRPYAGGRGQRPSEPGAPACRLGRHARVLRRASAEPQADQAAQGPWHLSISVLSRRDGGDPASRRP